MKKQPIFQLIKPYWTSSEKWSGIGLATLVLCLGLLNTGLLVWYNNWYGDFFNALQQKNMARFWAAVPVLLALMAGPLLVETLQSFTDSWLQLRWRRALSQHFIGRWLDRKAYYRIERDDIGDNPDQRIAEDTTQFITLTMSLTVRLVTTVASLGSFSYLTWTKGGTLDGDWLGVAWHIPGYMFWLALLFALLDMLLTHLAGWRLFGLGMRREAVEADFRYALIQTRDHAEQIALYHGEATEGERLQVRFTAIWHVSKQLFLVNAQSNFVGGLTSRATALLPLLVLAPRMLTGAVDLGTMMATASAFGATVSGLSWFANNYTTIARWRAAARRLVSLNQAIDALAPAGIERREQPGPSLHSAQLLLRRPDGAPLARVDALRVAAGERWMIAGRSGVGKSTLLRAIAGLWPHGDGVLTLPAHASRLFLPQTSYIPDGTLKAALCYPSPATAFSDAECRAALAACQLAPLQARLDQAARWSHTLSVGEQQRLAFCRALLHRPDFLFLDEATCALDEATEQQLYATLLEQLPHSAIVSIAHRPALAVFHHHTLTLTPAPAAH